MFEQTKELCQHFLKMGVPGFDLIVYHNGECVLRHMGGYADPENKIPIRGKEKYHLYSCSKLVTCTAAMQLWEKGLFSLDDKLSDYMPAFEEMTVKTENGLQKAKNPIRIEHLFRMTSGIHYNLRTPALLEYYEACGNVCPTVDLVNQIAKTPLEFEPGEGWKYGLSHDVLAALVEVLSGERFEQYVKKHIFDPLGMENSDFLHPVEDWEGFARQYRYDAETGKILPRWKNFYRPCKGYAAGGAGCTSTAEDFIKFLEALRIGDVILKKETIELMKVDRMTDRMREMYPHSSEDTSYGLGMRIPRPNTDHTEFGWGGAAGAFASVDPVNHISLFYVQHLLSPPNRHLRVWLYRSVRAALLGEEIQIPVEQTDANASLTY